MGSINFILFLREIIKIKKKMKLKVISHVIKEIDNKNIPEYSGKKLLRIELNFFDCNFY